jgi:hypothetical protein
VSTTLTKRPLNVIAAEIQKDWGSKMNPVAKRYVDAMASLQSVRDRDGLDTVVARFISVAGTWHGPIARRIKTELLKSILAMHEEVNAHSEIAAYNMSLSPSPCNGKTPPTKVVG